MKTILNFSISLIASFATAAMSYGHNFIFLDAQTGQIIESSNVNLQLTHDNTIIHEHTCEYPYVDYTFQCVGFQTTEKRLYSCENLNYRVHLDPIKTDSRISKSAISAARSDSEHIYVDLLQVNWENQSAMLKYSLMGSTWPTHNPMDTLS
jgi:hypothetical protein